MVIPELSQSLLSREFTDEQSEHRWNDFHMCKYFPACGLLLLVWSRDWSKGVFIHLEGQQDNTVHLASTDDLNTTLQIIDATTTFLLTIESLHEKLSQV